MMEQKEALETPCASSNSENTEAQDEETLSVPHRRLVVGSKRNSWLTVDLLPP